MPATIAVVGAGPGGCAAALTLRRYLPEIEVALVSLLPSGGPAVGETLSPGVAPLLSYLGVREDFLATRPLPSGGTASSWGSEDVFERNYLFTGRGAGWHLDRAQFDAWLFARAEAAGAHCLSGRVLLGTGTRSEGRWSVEIGGGKTVTADFIVDATGRSAQLVRRQASPPKKDDALVADIRWYTHSQTELRSGRALVESVPDGWWYSATLPGHRAVAMFMTDSDLRKQSSWEERLLSAPATKAHLHFFQPTGETAVRAANSQCSSTVSAEGWVAVGDAAAAFDPISSLGIGFALRSGIEAARVAAAAVEQDDGPVAAYAESVARIYADYRRRLRAIYRRERRWPRALFWSRRQY